MIYKKTEYAILLDEQEYLGLLKKATKQRQVFMILRDQKWHCRGHDYRELEIGQLAGSGGIQGIERGTPKRPGLELEHENMFCKKCKSRIRHDRWTGDFNETAVPINMSKKFQERVIRLLDSRDIVDNTTRPAPELTIDHKLPMIRWSKNTTKYQTGYNTMTDDDIRRAFQLLKKSNGSVSHNLLKSRACEHCLEYGKRGKPFGINFFWIGDENWGDKPKDDPDGCHGCGWYDFGKWRNELNKKLEIGKK